MRLTAVFATLVGPGVILAAPAQAGPPDDQFLAAMDQAQITYDTPQQVITYGHRVCEALREGERGKDLLSLIMAENPTVLEWQAGALLGASISSFCPEADGA